MNYNNFNEATKQPILLTSLASLMNPVAIVPALAIGAVGLATISAIKALKNRNSQEEEDIIEAEYDDEQDYEPYDEPLPTVESDGTNAVHNMSDEELQKEMIRQTMSELGKRSALARAKKRRN